MANEVATTTEKQNPLATIDDDFLGEIVADAEQFKETISQDDIAIPFVNILQSGSPQVKDEDPQYIEGARPGMIMNSVSCKLWDGKTGIRLIAVAYKASYIEWVPRNAGGGFVAEHNIADGARIVTARNDNNVDIIQHGSPLGTPGNQLVYTHTHYVFVIDEEGNVEPAVISLSSTNVKHSKRWNFLINNVKIKGATAPRFFGVWNMRSKYNKKDTNSWYTAEFTPDGNVSMLPNGRDIYTAAKEFAAGVASGKHAASHVQDEVQANPDIGQTVDLNAAGAVF